MSSDEDVDEEVPDFPSAQGPVGAANQKPGIAPNGDQYRLGSLRSTASKNLSPRFTTDPAEVDLGEISVHNTPRMKVKIKQVCDLDYFFRYNYESYGPEWVISLKSCNFSSLNVCFIALIYV